MELQTLKSCLFDWRHHEFFIITGDFILKNQFFFEFFSGPFGNSGMRIWRKKSRQFFIFSFDESSSLPSTIFWWKFEKDGSNAFECKFFASFLISLWDWVFLFLTKCLNFKFLTNWLSFLNRNFNQIGQRKKEFFWKRPRFNSS